jgi:hypothetical protein
VSIWAQPPPQGEASFDPKDAALFVYGMCVKAAQELAGKGERLSLQCSKHTFESHLDVPAMIAGPWHTWDIDDRVDNGVLLLRAAKLDEAHEELGRIVGRINISEGAILH